MGRADLFAVNWSAVPSVALTPRRVSALVRSVPKVVVVLAPSTGAAAVQRAWCCWELLCALEAALDVEFAQSVSDAAALRSALAVDFERAVAAASAVDVRTAGAVAAEADALAVAFAQRPGGADDANTRLRAALRAWLAKQGVALLAASDDGFAAAKLEPATRNALVTALAPMLRDAGDLGGAETMYRQLLVRYTDELGPTHARTLAATNNLASAIMNQGRLADSEPLYRQALEARRSSLGVGHAKTISSTINLANLMKNQGKPEEAVPLYEDALAATVAASGEDSADAAALRGKLEACAAAIEAAKSPKLAVAPPREAAAGNAEAGGSAPDDAPEVAEVASRAHALMRQGDAGACVPLYRTVLAARTAALGGGHPDTLAAANNLALALRKATDADAASEAEAESLLRHALVTGVDSLGPEHAVVAATAGALANALSERGGAAASEAVPLYRQAHAARRAALGDAHFETLAALHNLAVGLDRAGGADEAKATARAAWEGRRDLLGESHPDTLSSAANLAGLLSRSPAGLPEAEELYRMCVTGLAETAAVQRPATANAQHALAAVLAKRGAFTESADALRGALAASEALYGRGAPETQDVLYDFGVVSLRMGALNDAELAVREVFKTRTAAYGAQSPDTKAAEGLLTKVMMAKLQVHRAGGQQTAVPPPEKASACCF